jgi:hypothetical protein
MAEVLKGEYSEEELDAMREDASQPSEGSEIPQEEPQVEETPVEPVSEDEKTPQEEETSTPTEEKEEKTVPYSRFKKVNDRLKVLEKKEQKPKSRGTGDLASLKLVKKLTSNYSEEELDDLAEIAKSEKPEDIIRIAENPLIKDAIEAKRKKVAEENKVPAPSSAGFFGKLKKPIGKMSKEEFKEFEEEQQRKARGGKGI